MTTLVLSSWSLPSARALAAAATRAGWNAVAFDENRNLGTHGEIVYYGGTDLALEVAAHFRLALLEPPLDLLARLPLEFRLRTIQFASFADLASLKAPTFVKPADPLNKAFDPGVYSTHRQLQTRRRVPEETPVLVAEPVEWSSEFRCFVLERKLAAWSPYVSFGRPIWKAFDRQRPLGAPPPSLQAFCERLTGHPAIALPPGFVMDVGLIEDRGWAVVEFNPAWCSGLLGADPAQVLPVLQRVSRDATKLSQQDHHWLISGGR